MTSILRSPPRWIALAILATALPIAAGCGGGKGDVTGKVSYKNDPLPYGNVQFSTSAGVFVSDIGSDGTYTITGVPSGSAKISVTCQDPKYADYMKELSASARAGKAPPKGKPEDFDKIPTKYRDDSTSGLTYDVKSGKQTFDIKLQ